MKKLSKRSAFLLFLVLLLLIPSSTVVFGAQKSAADFYKGKTVELVIPFGVGGGTDRLGRMMIPYLEKNLGCKIVPNNKAGAGGLIGLNYLYGSKANGLVMGVGALNSGVWGEFVESKAVQFKMDKLTIIGGIEKQAMIICGRPDFPYKTFGELIGAPEPLKLAVPGKLSPMHIIVVLAADAWGFKVKVIPGYKGAAGMFKAVEGGEVDITCNSEIPSLPRIKAKTVIPIAYVTLERQKLLPDIPAVGETPPKNKAAFERFKNVIWMYRHERTLAMPPGVPADRIKFVREAFKKTLKDEALIKEGAKNGIQFIYTDQKTYRKEFDKLFGGMSAKDKEHVKALLR